ncbi:hypothetical protein D8674_042626 [Pyrus ussuriensis x Pyrus communis]|uniref:Uncharacterized protein n=1 Tax=Pyrus ussuriensis x Pyrus communis TaxID=2448454 RepID=A0A5N5I6H0_9ROSA|nr:hypothetical protein D8674_042626 [Pyrus ussuriensis x Pyrus communis]
MLLRRSFDFLFSRLGWEVGLFMAIILALFDAESPAIGNMMAPSGASGASNSGNWRQYLNFSSENEGDSAPEPSTARAPVREAIGRDLDQAGPSGAQQLPDSPANPAPEAPPVLFQQTIQVNNQIFTIPLEQTEINETIHRLPKEELKGIIGEDSIRHPINEFTAQQQANLMDLAILHFKLKKNLISEMKSLYPEHEWDFVPLIREKFFFGRQRDREYSCETLSKMLSDLQSKNKSASCAQKFRFEILNWNWKD